MTDHKPMPVSGYTPQLQSNIDLANIATAPSMATNAGDGYRDETLNHINRNDVPSPSQLAFAVPCRDLMHAHAE